MAASNLFDSYEQDFKQFITVIAQRLDADNNNEPLDQRKGTLRRVEMELEEADEMVSQMELETQGISQSVRSRYQARLQTAKAELAKYKKLSKEAQTQLNRSTLLGVSSTSTFASSDEPYGPSSDRPRLLAGTSLLEDGSRRLQESQRLALETEAQGTDILQNLRVQREQIEASRNTLQAAGGSIDKASSTLRGMIRRMYQQRIVTGAIIAVLILLIVIIAWEKLS